jgi:parallel beta-helix repeat protein
MKTRWLIGMAVGFFGVSLGVAGQLYGHGGDPDLIHTCVNNSSGAVDFIAPNGTCHSNEHPVDWDKAARTAVMTFIVDCDAGDKIGLPPTIGGMTIDLIPGDTLNVTGTCNENVTIREEIDRITLDGQGMATIAAPVSTQNAIQVRGRGITIKGFTISGGSSGINVARGGTATIDSNVVQNTAQSGINVTNSGFATIVNNTIQNNPLHGIQLSSGGSAIIGFRSGDPVASPNIIQNNGNIGINFSESSSARIDGNTITGNGSFGINVGESSSARIGFSGPVGSFTAANTIQNNGRDGIRVFGSSYAGIEGNVIDNNTGRGVIVDTSSTVEIGVRGFSNTIQNNAGGGIGLSRSSSARILAAVISNNTGNGVQISRASQADVGNNTINANTGDGIRVEENSGLNLNLVPAAPANSGSNGQFGIRCRIGGYANGSIGSLTGSSGQKDFGTTVTLTENSAVTVNSEGCIDRTTP